MPAPHLVRGRVIGQYMDKDGNKGIVGKISHDGWRGLITLNRIERMQDLLRDHGENCAWIRVQDVVQEE